LTVKAQIDGCAQCVLSDINFFFFRYYRPRNGVVMF